MKSKQKALPLRQRGCEIRVRFLSEWQQEFTTSTGELDTLILRSGRAQALSNAKPRYPRTRPKAKRIHLSRMKGAIHMTFLGVRGATQGSGPVVGGGCPARG
jgi:hypothetical protein